MTIQSSLHSCYKCLKSNYLILNTVLVTEPVKPNKANVNLMWHRTVGRTNVSWTHVDIYFPTSLVIGTLRVGTTYLWRLEQEHKRRSLGGHWGCVLRIQFLQEHWLYKPKSCVHSSKFSLPLPCHAPASPNFQTVEPNQSWTVDLQSQVLKYAFFLFE